MDPTVVGAAVAPTESTEEARREYEPEPRGWAWANWMPCGERLSAARTEAKLGIRRWLGLLLLAAILLLALAVVQSVTVARIIAATFTTTIAARLVE